MYLAGVVAERASGGELRLHLPGSWAQLPALPKQACPPGLQRFLFVVFGLVVFWMFWVKTIWLEPMMKPEDGHLFLLPDWQSHSVTGWP